MSKKIVIIGTGHLQIQLVRQIHKTYPTHQIIHFKTCDDFKDDELTPKESISTILVADQNEYENNATFYEIVDFNLKSKIIVSLTDPILSKNAQKIPGDIIIWNPYSNAALIFLNHLNSTDSASDRPKIKRREIPELSVAFYQVIKLCGGYIGILILFAVYFIASMTLSLVDSIYFTGTTATSTGYGDITPKDFGTMTKLATVILQFFGLFSTSVIMVYFLNYIQIKTRLRNLGHKNYKLSNHFIIGGGGRCAYEFAKILYSKNINAIIVEVDEKNRYLNRIRSEFKFPIYIGDAFDEDVLSQVNIWQARGLAITMPNDTLVGNIATLAHTMVNDLDIIARVYDEHGQNSLEKYYGVKDAFSVSSIGAKFILPQI